MKSGARATFHRNRQEVISRTGGAFAFGRDSRHRVARHVHHRAAAAVRRLRCRVALVNDPLEMNRTPSRDPTHAMTRATQRFWLCVSALLTFIASDRSSTAWTVVEAGAKDSNCQTVRLLR